MKNKVIVITGAASGLGKALATECYALGNHLALIDIDGDGLASVKEELNTNHHQTVSFHIADVSDEESMVATRAGIIRMHGRVDILINNAGISISQYFEALELNDYHRLLAVNFWGTVICAKYFLPDLLQQPDGRLVNIISHFALTGFPGKTAYASSKAAILGFSNSLQTELINTCVKICIVIPPALDTGLVKNGIHIDEKKRSDEMKFLRQHGRPLDKTAEEIMRQVVKGRYRIVIGPMMKLTDLLARLFPASMQRWIGKKKRRFDFV